MKSIKSVLSLFVLLAALVACDDDNDGVVREAYASISELNGTSTLGSATFIQVGDEVQLLLNLKNLTPGKHAVHIHTGACGDVSTIGDHWNPTGEPHGQRGVDEAFHRGDIGNVEVDSDGTGTLVISADDWTIGDSDDTNVVGNLLIVHAGADDYTTQPSGASGEIIGCGTIE